MSCTHTTENTMSKTASKITPCLWFDGTAEEAANFYASILPDSHVDAVHRAPNDYPSGKAGDVLLVEFTLMGQQFTGLNGGPLFKFNEAVSFQISVETQAEVDRLSDALSAAPGGRTVRLGQGSLWPVVADCPAPTHPPDHRRRSAPRQTRLRRHDADEAHRHRSDRAGGRWTSQVRLNSPISDQSKQRLLPKRPS